MLKRKKVLVLGDSHASIFRTIYMKIFMPWCKFKVISIPGATVSGLQNPNSKTGAINIYNEAIRNSKIFKHVIFLLGEVDTGFIIWYRAQKYNSSIDEMLNITLRNYECLLNSSELKGKNLIVLSTPLPTISDDNKGGAIANIRKEIKATIEERTKLTLRFNILLREIVKRSGHRFISLDRFSLQKDNKGSKKYLRNLKKTDHHYNKLAYSLLVSINLFNKLRLKQAR